MSARDGGPAFPVSTSRKSGGAEFGGELGHQDSPNTWQFPGMTLRDYFAGQALAGMLAYAAVESMLTGGPEVVPPKCAEAAYTLADAMLAARESHP